MDTGYLDFVLKGMSEMFDGVIDPSDHYCPVKKLRILENHHE